MEKQTIKPNIIKFHFYKGTGFVSKLIKWRTISKYSHVAIEINNRIIEAKEGQGVIARVPSCLTNKEFDTIEIKVVDKVKFNAFYDFLVLQIGKPYDWEAIFNFIKNWDKENPNKWFCSELGDTVFSFLITKWEKEKNLVSPELLYHRLKYYKYGLNN